MADVRLIDANALLKEFEKRQEQQVNEYCDCFLNDAQELSTEWWCVEDAVTAAPTISAVPVAHGRWDKPVEHGLPYAANHLGVVCSYCCKWSDNDYNYCPNCGAKMDAQDMDVPTKDGGASDG